MTFVLSKILPQKFFNAYLNVLSPLYCWTYENTNTSLWTNVFDWTFIVMHFLNCLIEGFSLTLKSMMPMLVLSVKGNLSIGFNLLWNFFFFLRAQLLNYKEALNLTKYLKKEKEYLPWQRVISAVTYIISMFEDDKELYPVIEVMLMLYLMKVDV